MTDSIITQKYPVIDTGLCILCEGCVAIAENIFFRNQDTGLIDVVWQERYPQEIVDEAIKNCPKDCISWNEYNTIKNDG